MVVPLVLALAAMTTVPREVPATDTGIEDQNLFNWSYATAFGTGVYQVGDRTVGVIRVPLGLRLLSMTDAHWGLRLTMPLTFGFADFNFFNIIDDGLPDKVGTFSVAPGVEAEVPLRRNWRLKPFVNVGYGLQVNDSVDSFIYSTGLKSLYRFARDPLDFEWGNALNLTGYVPNEGDSDSLTAFITAINARYPLGVSAFDRRLNLGLQFTYYLYLDGLEFPLPGVQPKGITHEFELGFSLGVYRPVSILGIEFDRIGLAARLGGNLKGVRLVTDFPF